MTQKLSLLATKNTFNYEKTFILRIEEEIFCSWILIKENGKKKYDFKRLEKIINFLGTRGIDTYSFEVVEEFVFYPKLKRLENLENWRDLEVESIFDLSSNELFNIFIVYLENYYFH